MKLWGTFLLAAGLVLGGVCVGQAVDFKAEGSWQFAFDYINGGSFMGKTRQGSHVGGQQWAAVRQQRDAFEAVQRLHLQLQAVASESLSGVVFFEVGEQRWGMAAQGGALGTDGMSVKVKQAYIDWTIPDTALRLRIGLQGVKLPGFALDNPVFHDDAAGIAASWKGSDAVSLTALWIRPYNDNWLGNGSHAGYGTGSYSPADYMDNFDLFALLVPLNFDGVKITPWAMGGSMGPNAVYTIDKNGAFVFSNPSASGQAIDGLQVKDGLFPAAYSTGRSVSHRLPTEYNTLFWGGLTADVTLTSPWRFSGDFVYGSVDSGRTYLNRSGWFGMLLAEYAAAWGTPGLYGWYFSGDDGNPHNGSERLPYIATTNNLHNSLSTFGYRGNPIMGGGKGVLGANPNGTWGVGARVKKLSFVDDLSHVLRVDYFGGANNPRMASYITGRRSVDGSGRDVVRNNTDFNSFGTYLTTADTGMEINCDTSYKMYENLTLLLETGYIHLWLDDDVWGRYGKIPGDSLNYKDAWKVSLNVIYAF